MAETTALVVAEGEAPVGRSLPELEEAVARGFMEMAVALKEIKDRQLYREAGYTNFDTYCKERFGFSKQRAYQIIEAAENTEGVRILTPPGTPLPANAGQAEALSPLKDDPEKMAAAWEEAVETAPNGKVTAEYVATVVERHQTSEPVSEPVPPVRPQAEAISQCEQARDLAGRIAKRLERLKAPGFSFGDRMELERLLETAVRCLKKADQLRPGAADEPLDTRRETPDERFRAFHKANPEVYERIREAALREAAESEGKLNVRRLIGEGTGVNNNLTPYYVRLLMEREPALRGRFVTRGRST